VGPETSLDDVKRKFLTLPGLFNSNTSVVKPIASCYTDYARLALVIFTCCVKLYISENFTSFPPEEIISIICIHFQRGSKFNL
jgi:uncharacterized membrane protein YczE